MAAGDKSHGRSSMRQVADLAGVAMSSVSRVLSNHPDASDAMREKVMSAVEELGYEPDILAQSLRRRATRTVGFVVGDISNPLIAEIVEGAETTLRDAGYSMLLTNSESDPELDVRHIRLLQQRRADGLLLSLAAEDHPASLKALRDFEGPVAVIDRELPRRIGASAVLSDHRSGMHAAVSHLLDLGHERIGLILGPALRFSRERQAGLEEAYAERGASPSFTVLSGQLGSAHRREATAQLLDQKQPVTAIVAGGNQLVIGALEELQARKLRVGKDVSLVSCDTVTVTELYQPPIAVVRRDTRELGRSAAQLLLDQLENEAPASSLTLPTAFLARPSCAPPKGTVSTSAGRR
jgi:LacI family transcriptional regulator